MRIGAVVLICTVGGLTPLSAQEWRMAGRLLPEVAGVPYAGAAVTVVETGETVCADESGRFGGAVGDGHWRAPR